ncbi:endocuticle structural protein SgAbd-6-like [Teleopsis dalmanni]|uniref:endocuticle structural protein SgAbd-6-like n=1 Tax=Teleopsis dalmanni TaxID=139649 RepID=UPI0018CE25F3|nr:endocuticle structural protein SgAbd-6-like [Teleopsis dalmanni]XP_037941329.1 endocuticle structural protein SgAbd-6-like [Teleopsis dalmanni]
MKLMLVFVVCTFIAVCSAAPQSGKDVETIEYESDVGPDGYKFSYKLSDGTIRTEEGVLKNVGTENESISVTGSVTWVGPDGVTYTMTFVSDENGFQPEGAHIPK